MFSVIEHGIIAVLYAGIIACLSQIVEVWRVELVADFVDGCRTDVWWKAQSEIGAFCSSEKVGFLV